MVRVFDLVGLTIVSNILATISSIDLALLVFYFSARYTGNFPDAVTKIDYFAELFWLGVSCEVYCVLCAFSFCFLVVTGSRPAYSREYGREKGYSSLWRTGKCRQYDSECYLGGCSSPEVQFHTVSAQPVKCNNATHQFNFRSHIFELVRSDTNRSHQKWWSQ